ncbi:MAG: N4-gp56 family major capsid protein [Deltaproteobacteria bacterium]|nr:N4-gp56 family major capsid protein [Deltaproteobacteria bacterium]
MAYGTSPAMYVGTDSLGGFQVDTVLTEKAFHKPQPLARFRQFLEMKIELGKQAGDTVYFTKWADISTQGSVVAESSTIPVDRHFTLSQATATVDEFGNSVSFHSRLYDLGNVDVQNEIAVGLLNDEVKAMDSRIEANVYDACSIRYVGTATDGGAFTTDGTATATSTSVFNAYHLRQMRKKLRQLNVPPFDGINYVLIAAPSVMDNLFTDDNWQKAEIYGNEAKGLLNGEVGRLFGVRVIEASHALADPFPNSSLSGEGYMLGAGFGFEVLVSPPEVRSNVELAKSLGSASDFGRKLEAAWYEMAAFGTLWNESGDGNQCNCIKWDSA